MQKKQYKMLNSIIKNLHFFENFSKEEIYEQRKTKFLKIGRDKGFTKSSKSDNLGLGYEQSILLKVKRHLTENKYIYLGLFFSFLLE